MKLAGIYRYDGLQCSCMECKILPVHLLFLLNLTKKRYFGPIHQLNVAGICK